MGVAAKPFDQKHHAHLPEKEKPPCASGGELQVFFVFTHIGLSLATVDLQSRLATPAGVS
jgi:hypothetical protein